MCAAIDNAATHERVETGRPSLYRRLVTSQYLRHNALVLAGNVLAGGCSYLLHPVLTRVLSRAEYGTVAALIALLGIFLIPVLIISVVVGRYAATLSATGKTAQLHDLVRRLTGILLATGVVLAAVFMIASSSIAAFEHVKSVDAVLVMSLALIIAFASSVNVGALQGLQRFGWVSALTVLPALLRVLLAAALVLLGFGATGAMLGIVLSNILPYLVSFLPLRDLLSGPRIALVSLRPLLSYSLVAALVSISNTLLLNLDTVLAKHYLGPQQSGLYAAMAVLGRTVLFVSTSVGMVMFPRVAALHERGERHTRVVLHALLGVFALSTAVEAVFCVAPTLVIRVLFTPQYLPMAGQLAWYGFAILLLALAQVLTVYFLSVGHRFFALFLLASCGVQLVLMAVAHQTIEQIVHAVLVANGLLLVTLLATFAMHARRRPHPAESIA